MSVERQAHQPEQHERSTDIEEIARQQLESLKQTETSPEQSATERAEAAREVINRPEARPEPEPSNDAEQSTSRPSVPLLHPKLNYQHTMASLRRHLSPASRTFSQVIHAPAVEKVSELIESNVARPSVLNGALWTAVAVGGTFYVVARTYGYNLAGSEMLFSLIGGAVLGLLIEAVWRAARR